MAIQPDTSWNTYLEQQQSRMEFQSEDSRSGNTPPDSSNSANRKPEENSLRNSVEGNNGGLESLSRSSSVAGATEIKNLQDFRSNPLNFISPSEERNGSSVLNQSNPSSQSNSNIVPEITSKKAEMNSQERLKHSIIYGSSEESSKSRTFDSKEPPTQTETLQHSVMTESKTEKSVEVNVEQITKAAKPEMPTTSIPSAQVSLVSANSTPPETQQKPSKPLASPKPPAVTPYRPVFPSKPPTTLKPQPAPALAQSKSPKPQKTVSKPKKNGQASEEKVFVESTRPSCEESPENKEKSSKSFENSAAVEDKEYKKLQQTLSKNIMKGIQKAASITARKLEKIETHTAAEAKESLSVANPAQAHNLENCQDELILFDEEVGDGQAIQTDAQKHSAGGNNDYKSKKKSTLTPKQKFVPNSAILLEDEKVEAIRLAGIQNQLKEVAAPQTSQIEPELAGDDDDDMNAFINPGLKPKAAPAKNDGISPVSSITYNPAKVPGVTVRDAFLQRYKRALRTLVFEATEDQQPVRNDPYRKDRKDPYEEAGIDKWTFPSNWKAPSTQDVELFYPQDPSRCQHGLADGILRALKQGKHGVFEAPPGSGKTTTGLVAALGYLRKNKTQRVLYVCRDTENVNRCMSIIKTCTLRVQVAVLDTRDRLCVNPMLKPVSGMQRDCDCVGLLRLGYCRPYSETMSPVVSGELVKTLKSKLLDIEELGKLGDPEAVCPYYLGRLLAKEAQLILVPYQMLLNEDQRDSLIEIVQGSTIFFDDAEDLEDATEFSSSISLHSEELSGALMEINRFLGIQLPGFDSLHACIGRVRDKLEAFLTTLTRKGPKTQKPLLLSQPSLLDLFADVLGADSPGMSAAREASTVYELLDKVIFDHGHLLPHAYLLKWARCLQQFACFMVNKATPPAVSTSNFGIFPGTSIELAKYDLSNYSIYLESPPLPNFGVRLTIRAMTSSFAMHELESLKPKQILIMGHSLGPKEYYLTQFGLPFEIAVKEDKHPATQGVGFAQQKGDVSSQSLLSVSVLSKIADNQKDMILSGGKEGYSSLETLGNLILQMLSRTPGGTLLVFPQANLLQDCFEVWKETGIIDKIQDYKRVLKDTPPSTVLKISAPGPRQPTPAQPLSSHYMAYPPAYCMSVMSPLALGAYPAPETYNIKEDSETGSDKGDAPTTRHNKNAAAANVGTYASPKGGIYESNTARLFREHLRADPIRGAVLFCVLGTVVTNELTLSPLVRDRESLSAYSARGRRPTVSAATVRPTETNLCNLVVLIGRPSPVPGIESAGGEVMHPKYTFLEEKKKEHYQLVLPILKDLETPCAIREERVSGIDWWNRQWQNLANKSLSCLLRGRIDYGSVVLVWERYQSKKDKSYLPEWLRYDPKFSSPNGYELLEKVDKFVKASKETVNNMKDVQNLRIGKEMKKMKNLAHKLIPELLEQQFLSEPLQKPSKPINPEQANKILTEKLAKNVFKPPPNYDPEELLIQEDQRNSSQPADRKKKLDKLKRKPGLQKDDFIKNDSSPESDLNDRLDRTKKLREMSQDMVNSKQAKNKIQKTDVEQILDQVKHEKVRKSAEVTKETKERESAPRKDSAYYQNDFMKLSKLHEIPMKPTSVVKPLAPSQSSTLAKSQTQKSRLGAQMEKELARDPRELLPMPKEKLTPRLKQEPLRPIATSSSTRANQPQEGYNNYGLEKDSGRVKVNGGYPSSKPDEKTRSSSHLSPPVQPKPAPKEISISDASLSGGQSMAKGKPASQSKAALSMVAEEPRVFQSSKRVSDSKEQPSALQLEKLSRLLDSTKSNLPSASSASQKAQASQKRRSPSPRKPHSSRLSDQLDRGSDDSIMEWVNKGADKFVECLNNNLLLTARPEKVKSGSKRH